MTLSRLHEAAMYMRQDQVKLFLEAGDDVNMKNSLGIIYLLYRIIFSFSLTYKGRMREI